MVEHFYNALTNYGIFRSGNQKMTKCFAKDWIDKQNLYEAFIHLLVVVLRATGF